MCRPWLTRAPTVPPHCVEPAGADRHYALVRNPLDFQASEGSERETERTLRIGWWSCPLLVVALSPVPAAADCVAPEVFAGAGDKTPGDVVTVEGSGFNECNDTPSGCSGPSTPPLESVAVSLVHDGRTVLRQEVAPDADGDFRLEIRIPPRASPGFYELVAGGPSGTEASSQITVD